MPRPALRCLHEKGCLRVRRCLLAPPDRQAVRSDGGGASGPRPCSAPCRRSDLGPRYDDFSSEMGCIVFILILIFSSYYFYYFLFLLILLLLILHFCFPV